MIIIPKLQKPGPSDIVIYRLVPDHFLLCKSPGAGLTFRCKSPGVPGEMVTSIEKMIDHQYRENSTRNIYSDCDQMKAYCECYQTQSQKYT